MLSADVVIIGAGVVGLALAQRIAERGRSVIALEREARIGTHSSSRNSEVIHAGLYYAPGSLKARLCVRGKELLYAFCAERGVPHARIGKLIVATDESQLPALAALKARGERNGVLDLEFLSAEQSRALGPPEAPRPAAPPAPRPVVYRPGQMPAGLPNWFAELDTDRDGQVGLYEWRAADRIADDFVTLDLNQDGFATAEEILKAQRARR